MPRSPRSRRRRLARFAGAVLLLVHAPIAATARADDYPTRPIRIIVSYPAGGANDLIARIIGSALQHELDQPIVVDNRGGAGGTIGADVASKAAPDGYTLFMAAGA